MIEAMRCRPLNDRDRRRGRYVLYRMQQAQRASFNLALEYAIERATAMGCRCWSRSAQSPGSICAAAARSARTDAERE